jgi:hypothetical protein
MEGILPNILRKEMLDEMEEGREGTNSNLLLRMKMALMEDGTF